MSKSTHLKILRTGVNAWNEWRSEHPQIRPDLSGAALPEAKLSRVNLDEASLTRSTLDSARLLEASLIAADLREARLSLADLRKASFKKANLKGANLSRGNATGADFSRADLSSTDLRGANLQSASLLLVNLSRAVLDHANFTEVRLGFTNFGNVDLSSVIGLETVEHLGPSTVGIDTLCNSKGRIPEGFLRGCGLPESFMTFAHSLVTDSIQYYSCFISHSSKDKGFADRLHADLQARSIRCWYAPQDLKIGDRFRIRIEESIRIYDKVMIVLSDNSIQSAWVEEEVEAALERERQHPGSLVLFPIRLDDATMTTNQAWAASLRRTRHIGDFSHWKNHDSYQNAFERLLRDLKSETKAERSAGGAGTK